jgi:hypothetical protein
MKLGNQANINISDQLLEAIWSFSVQREVEHCGVRMTVSPFDFYAECPRCGAKIKLRSFSGVAEIEDIFDAVFEWMNQPLARDAAGRRQMALREDE